MGIDSIVTTLNRLYICDKDKYKEECDYWKSKGYKLYRDNQGRHKVLEPQKPQKVDMNNVFGDIFGNTFGNIFNGGK